MELAIGEQVSNTDEEANNKTSDKLEAIKNKGSNIVEAIYDKAGNVNEAFTGLIKAKPYITLASTLVAGWVIAKVVL